MSTFIIGLDLGQRNDYTAAAVIERDREQRDPLPGSMHYQYVPTYTVHQLDRIRQVSYVTVADNLAALMRSTALQDATLVVDETGVGAGVVDLLKERGLTPRRVTITGGDQVTRDGTFGFRVPKRDLATAVALVLEQRRLQVPASLPHAETLRSELGNFRVKVNLAGHDTYGAGAEWREGAHDDLVLAVALAVWFGEHHGDASYYVQEPPPFGAEAEDDDDFARFDDPRRRG